MRKNLIPLVTAINAGGEFMSASEVTRPQHGLVALANADSFNNTHYSDPLTAYTQGWRDPENIDEVLDFLFPAVQVGRRFEWYKHDEESDFLVDTDDERAPGADFKQVRATGKMNLGKTTNKGLTMFVDMDQVADIQNWDQIYTGRLLRRCKRNDLYGAVMLLVAAASNANKTWDGASDPDADVMAMVNDAGDLIGFNPNRLAYFGNTWIKRVMAYRGQDNEGAKASLMLKDASELAKYVGAEIGRVVTARLKVQGAQKNKIGGNYVVAFHGENGVGPEDPSATKRFWSPCDGGGEYRVFKDNTNPKFTRITVERYNTMIVTSTLGLKKLTVA
jgi:hypothetical protein